MIDNLTQLQYYYKSNRMLIRKLFTENRLFRILGAFQKYSTSPTSQSDQVERRTNAIMALEIISQIKKQDKTGEPLFDRIQNVKVPDWAEIQEQASQKFIKKYFDDGIDNVSLDIFNQIRIRDPLAQAKNNKLVFFPLSTVTTHLFRKFNNKLPGTRLLLGVSGTGKTFALALYYHLSQEIMRYRYPLSLQTSQEIDKKVIEHYQENPFFNTKVFYYSYNTKDSQEILLNKIRLQYQQQFTLKKSWRKTSMQQLCTQLIGEYRKKRIKIDFFFDQINALAAVMRTTNQRIKFNIKYPEQDLIQAIQMKKDIRQLQTLARQTLGNFYFNSSMNIEPALLGKQDAYQNFTTLELIGHSRIQEQYQIPFLQEFNSDIYKKQVARLFAKEIQLRLPMELKKQYFSYEQWKKHAEQQVFLKLSCSWNSLIRPYQIRLAVNLVIDLFTQVQTVSSKADFQKILEKSIELLLTSTIQDRAQQVERFLIKSKQQSTNHKNALFMKMLSVFVNQLSEEQKSQIIIKVPTERFISQLIQNYQKKQEGDLRHRTTEELIFNEKVINREFLSIKDNNVVLYCSAKDYAKILSKAKVHGQFDAAVRMLFNTGNALFGLQLEAYFLELVKNHKKVTMSIQGVTMTFEQGKTVSSFHHFTTAHADGFKNIQGVYEKCLQNQGQYVIGYPVKFTHKIQESSETNHAFDYIIAKYNSPNTLEIRSLDFAATEGRKVIKTKLLPNNKLKIFQKINQKQKPIGLNIVWQHTVVGRLPLISSQSIEIPEEKQIKFSVMSFDQIFIESAAPVSQIDDICNHLFRMTKGQPNMTDN